MVVEPRQLIAEVIGSLETLSAYFADEIADSRATDRHPVEMLAAKEALQIIKVLIPKLRTAQGSLVAGSSQLQFRECAHCE